MPFDERKAIIENLSFVDLAIDFEDDDHGSATNALNKVKKQFPNDTIYFANGGDRDDKNIPEMNVKGIEFLFGVGGDHKINSSSSILKKLAIYQRRTKMGTLY